MKFLIHFFVSCLFFTHVVTAQSSVLKELIKNNDRNTPFSNTVIREINDSSFENNQNFFPSRSNSRYFQPNEVSIGLTGLDQKIDADKYRIGTGDGFSIYLWGTINKHFKSIVNIEGNFIIADIGDVNIKGKTLREAKEIIKNKIMENYKQVEITIVLDEIRNFKIYLLGEINRPGYYFVNGAMRVSDLLQLAGGINDSGSLRKISIINSTDSSKNYADVAFFYNCNVIDQNPYLNEGDRVFVPKTNESVIIYGAVNYPGIFDYVENDSLSTILKIAGGLTRGADSSRIMVKRFENNYDSLSTIFCSFADSTIYKFKLKPDDRIIVFTIPDYRVYRNVTITGEVNYPGTYPIKKDKTTIGQIIKLAGGFTTSANLKSSTINRKLVTNTGETEFLRLKNMPPELLSPLERSLLFSKIDANDSIVRIDFEKLANSNNEVNNFILRDGDEIRIAENTYSVKLIGGVINPGLVEHKDGAHINYYICKTNGFSKRARKNSIKIMKSGSEIWRNSKEIDNIEPGDVIWVPEKFYKNRFNISKEAIFLLGSLATIIISAFTINEFVKE